MADCAVFILWDDERKLALMEDRPDLNPGSEHYWVYPGGKINPGEDPRDVAEREAWEELHVALVDAQRLAGDFRSRGVPGTRSGRLSVWVVEPYLVEVWVGDVPDRSLDEQRAPLAWRDPAGVEANDFTCNRQIAEALLDTVSVGRS